MNTGTFSKWVLASILITTIGCEETKEEETTSPSQTVGMSCDPSGSSGGFTIAAGSGSVFAAYINGMNGTSVSSVKLHLFLGPDAACGTGAQTLSLDLMAYSDDFQTMTQTSQANSVTLSRGATTEVTFNFNALPITSVMAFRMAITSSSDTDCKVVAETMNKSATCPMQVNASNASPLTPAGTKAYAGTIVAQ